MRAMLVLLAVTALAPVSLGYAHAQAVELTLVEMSQACARGPGRAVRLESVENASALAMCQVSRTGSMEACTISEAAPDTDGVHYFALQQLCFVSAASPGDGAAPLVRYRLDFNVVCTRERNGQVCSVSGARIVPD